MTEKRYTLNQQISTNNKGDLASYIDGIYDWYNNEKLDWYEAVDRLNKQDEQMQELEGENKQLKQKMLRLYNYFEDWFEDIIPPDAFSEMWDNVKEDKKWEN